MHAEASYHSFRLTYASVYVITDIFKPHPETSKKYDLIFIGRSSEQKNLSNLLKALIYLKSEKREVSLLMVGDCCKDASIKRIIDREGLNVTLAGNIPNYDLPNLLNQARIFILPSYYEGHPKALLEAMSCGLPCIGANVMGIKEDLDHLKTGYLCDTDFKGIADSIDVLSADRVLQETIGRNAREYILKNYSLDIVMKMELDIINEVIAL